MKVPSVGDLEPLVTRPTWLPSCQTLYPWRGIPGSSSSRPTRRRVSPDAACAARAARPTNSPLSSLTTHARPASSGVVVASMSVPQSGSPASRRRVSRAPSPAGSPPRRVRGDPAEVLLRVGRVDDQEVALRPEAVEDQVVEHAACLVAQQRVLRVADPEPPDVVHSDLLADGRGRRTPHLDLAHVAHVE